MTRNKRGLTKEAIRARSVEMYVAGTPIGKVAAQLAVRKATVAQHVREAGVTIRKPDGQGRFEAKVADVPIGYLPPGHQLRALDESILRDRLLCERSELRREMLRGQP